MRTATKDEILTLLKRNGGHSVKELAAFLGLSPVTIRQHLTHLERDGLLQTERRVGKSGRPAYLYRLTVRGHAEGFPYRSDRLVELLVREVGQLSSDDFQGRTSSEKTYLVLQRLAKRLADEYAPLLQGWPLQERVVFVTEVMQSDGGFAEWAATERGFEIRDFNCLFHRLLAGGACDWHQGFLSRMLGADVIVRPCDDAGQCCRYFVEPAAAAVEQTA
ncbi:MAG: winged helix-turn-helix transcriptional regulator [Dehalococcoidia bacterium]